MLFQKEVIVCRSCGERVPANSKFCPKCGEPTDKESGSLVQRQTFAGQVKKCPNCGAAISSYTIKCPDCGIELSNVNNDDAHIKEFANKIMSFDQRIGTESGDWSSWSVAKKAGWVILNIYLIGIPWLIYNYKRKKSPVGNALAEKKSYIENYTFPNDRQSIIDALIFVKDKLFSITIKGTAGGNYEWAKIWRNKSEQLFQQAELLFPGDSIARDAYQSSVNYYQQIEIAKKERTKRVIIIVIAVILASYALVFLQNLLGIQR